MSRLPDVQIGAESRKGGEPMAKDKDRERKDKKDKKDKKR